MRRGAVRRVALPLAFLVAMTAVGGDRPRCGRSGL